MTKPYITVAYRFEGNAPKQLYTSVEDTTEVVTSKTVLDKLILSTMSTADINAEKALNFAKAEKSELLRLMAKLGQDKIYHRKNTTMNNGNKTVVVDYHLTIIINPEDNNDIFVQVIKTVHN